MLGLLLCLLLASVGCNTIQQLDSQPGDRRAAGEVAVTTRPHIYKCRSPNMEVFTCWWHPLSNLTQGEEVTYVLTYSKDNEPKRECPDYTSAGPNSCHFDSSHTFIWNIYCLNVTAVTTRQNFTSRQHCLDVADIVQTEAPTNLTYQLMDAGGDEIGHDVHLSWAYPRPSDLKYGWITLVYELQYRQVSEPDKWKVKELLREPEVKLLGLPINDYVLRVRCRSLNHGLWSNWSQPLLMSIPTLAPPADKLLVVILVTSISIVTLFVVSMRVIPQCVRVKDFFWPSIPKPRIMGIDPMLLKKGNLDEINCHLTNFHGYIAPSFMDTEVWDQVILDNISIATDQDCTIATESSGQVMDAFTVPHDLMPSATLHQLVSQPPATFTQSPYCMAPPQAFSPSSWPEVNLPDSSSSTMEQPSAAPPALSTTRPPQDLYSCVQLMKSRDRLQLVPCQPPAYCELPPLPKSNLHVGVKEEDEDLGDYETQKKDAALANER